MDPALAATAAAVCVGEVPEDGVTEDGVVLLNRGRSDAGRAARLGHLLLHVRAPIRISEGARCEADVERAVVAEQAASAAEDRWRAAWSEPPLPRARSRRGARPTPTGAGKVGFHPGGAVIGSLLVAVAAWADGHTVIGWGSLQVGEDGKAPAITELDADGDVVFELTLPDNQWSYRAFAAPGDPRTFDW